MVLCKRPIQGIILLPDPDQDKEYSNYAILYYTYKVYYIYNYCVSGTMVQKQIHYWSTVHIGRI